MYLNLLSLIEEDLMKKNTTFREAISPRKKLVWGKKNSLIVFIIRLYIWKWQFVTAMQSSIIEMYPHIRNCYWKAYFF
jgi:hypothetical protein